MFLIAFMLGMSNVILEETRMVNDTRVQIEQQEVQPDDTDGIDLTRAKYRKEASEYSQALHSKLS